MPLGILLASSWGKPRWMSGGCQVASKADYDLYSRKKYVSILLIRFGNNIQVDGLKHCRMNVGGISMNWEFFVDLSLILRY